MADVITTCNNLFATHMDGNDVMCIDHMFIYYFRFLCGKQLSPIMLQVEFANDLLRAGL